MGRVRLNSGALSPGQVRLNRRGASERLTPAGNDIRDAKPQVGKRERACSWCGSTKAVVLVKRRNRCGKCRSDEALVAKAKADLQSLGVGVLGAPGSEDPVESKIRADAAAAAARLEERQTRNPNRKAVPGRSLSAADRGRVLGRLEQQIGQLERRLAKKPPPLQEKELRQNLLTARNLRQQLRQQGASQAPKPRFPPPSDVQPVRGKRERPAAAAALRENRPCEPAPRPLDG